MKFLTSVVLVSVAAVCSAYSTLALAALTTPSWVAATKAMPWIDAIPSVGGYTFNGMGRIVPNNVEGFLLTHGADGSVYAKASTALPVSASSAIVDVTAKIPKAQVAKAIGSFIAKGMPLIGTLSALYILAKDLNIIAKNSPGEAPTFTETLRDRLGDCQTSFAPVLAQNSHYVVTADGTGYCTVVEKVYDGSTTYITSGFPTTTSGDKLVTLTPEQFMDRFNNKNDWAPDRPLPDLFKQAVKSGADPVEATGVSVSGPPSRQVSQSTTTNAPMTTGAQPTQTTNTTTNNYTYEGSRVTISNQTTSSTTNNAGDVTNTTSTTTDTNPTPEDAATDTALPALPKLYTPKYPGGMAAVWQTQRDALSSSPLFTIAKQLMPSVSAGGNCPTMPVNLSFSTWANFGVKDVAPPCYVWDWGRAICIISACLLARRLIFGG